MADDKNKDLMGTRGEEILRVRREKNAPSVSEVRVNARISQEIAEIDKVISDTSKSLDERLIAASNIQARVNSLKALAESLKDPRVYSAQKSFETATRTATGPRAIQEDISRYQRSSAAFSSGLSMAESMTTSQLEDKQRMREAELTRQNERILSAAHAGAPEHVMRGLWRQQEMMKSDIGGYKSAMATQRSLGRDTPGQLMEAIALKSKIDERKNESMYRKEVRSGAAGSMSEISQNAEKAVERFTLALEKLREATDRSTDSEEEKTKKIEDEKNALDELKAARSDVEKSEIQKDEIRRNGGGFASKLSGIGQIMQSTGQSISTFGGMWRQWSVGQDMDTSRLQTGYLDIVNRRYMDNVKASQGDAAALLRIKEGQHQRSSSFARSMGGKEVTASGMEAGGSVLSTLGTGAIGVAEIAAGVALSETGIGALAGIPLMEKGASHIGNFMSGAKDTSGQLAKLQSGAVRSEQELVAYGQDEARFNAERAAQAYVQQTAIDYAMNSTMATRGFGAGKRSITQQLRSGALQGEMAGYGIDLGGMLSMAQSGQAVLGGSYSKEDMTRAGQLTKSGQLASPEEYAQLRAQISGLGGDRENLEKVLKNAVAAGMDSSKYINDMVRGISNIASSTSRGGVSTFGGAAENMALTLQSLRSSGLDPNVATQAAADMNKFMSEAAGSRDLTISNVAEFAELRKLFPTAGTTTMSRLRTMRPEEFRTITGTYNDKGEATEATKKALYEQGLPGDTTPEQIRGAMRASARQAISTRTGVGIDMRMEKALQDRLSSGKSDVSDQELGTYWNATAHYSGGVPLPMGAPLETISAPLDPTARAKAADIQSKTQLGSLEQAVQGLIPGSRVTSGFGHRERPKLANGGLGSAEHMGIDISGKAGQAEYAVGAGKIHILPGGHGYEVVSEDGSRLGYFHSKTTLAEGTEVKKGMQVGEVGPLDSMSTGEHAHIYRKSAKDEFEDPTEYLRSTAGAKGGESEAGQQGLEAKATALVTAFNAGLPSLSENVKLMAESAKKIDPSNFQTAIDESSGKLGGTLRALDESLVKLNTAVSNLGGAVNKLGGQVDPNLKKP